MQWPAGTLPPGTDQVDDVGFIAHLIDVFAGTMGADAQRVYVAGSSLGGSMSYTLSCHLADRLAAIAATHSQVTSELAAEFGKAAPLPVLIITGTADMTVPAEGFGSIVSTEQNIAYWKARNGIAVEPARKSLDASVAGAAGDMLPLGVIQDSWPGPLGNELVWRRIVNGGHSLPGSEVFAVYDFLLRHTRKR